MKPDYLLWAQLGFALLTALCFLLAATGSWMVLLRMGLQPAQATKRIVVFAAVTGLWLGLVSVLSLTGFTGDFSRFPLNIVPFLLVPFITILVLTFHPKFRPFLLHVPHSWLMHLQVFRVPVEVFLWWLFLAEVLPEQMTFEGRNQDVLTGLTAPVLAWLCFGGGRRLKSLALLWNLLGFGLLLNIVITALLSMPTPFRVFMNEPSNTIVTTFPIIYLPVALVPLAYSLHFFYFRKAWLERKQQNEINVQRLVV